MTQATEELRPADYLTLPLPLFTITDLTDALGIEQSAKLLDCSKRYIYVVRNSSALAVERVVQLIEAVKLDEPACRQRLVVQRQAQASRQRRKAD